MFYFARLIKRFKKFCAVFEKSAETPSKTADYPDYLRLHRLSGCNLSLVNRRGQAAVEYFLIFAAVAAIALLGASIFYDKAHTMATGFFNNTANAIMSEPAGGVTPPLPQCLQLYAPCQNDEYRGTPGGCCLELSCQSGKCFPCVGLNQKCGAGVPLPCCPEAPNCQWDTVCGDYCCRP